MNQLQKSLRLNAVFSGISGIFLILFPKFMSNVFSVDSAGSFSAIGLGLLYFSSTIIWEIKKQRRKAVYFIIIQDFLWVAGSVVILIMDPFKISFLGNLTIVVIALIVLFMGINQLRALNS